MEPLMIALIALLALVAAAFVAFIIVKNKRIKELNSEIRLYLQLTDETSRHNDAIIFGANLNDYSAGIIQRLSQIMVQSYQRFIPKWSLACFGMFLEELVLVKDQEKKDLIKNTFTYALGSLDAKILADIITNHLKIEGDFDEPNAKNGLLLIVSVILKSGDAGQLATCFNREFEENIKELLASPEISDDAKVLIHAGLIKIKKMLTA